MDNTEQSTGDGLDRAGLRDALGYMEELRRHHRAHVAEVPAPAPGGPHPQRRPLGRGPVPEESR
ncbi:hypothetical protein ACWCXH_33885 [Kitasatospora sp. NPDC001660]